MTQKFGPRANGITRLLLAGAALAVIVVAIVSVIAPRSHWATLGERARQQPVPFSHEHHVAGLGLDCRYCHTGVENSSFAGLPATEICMTCHSQIWTNADMLAPVRESFAQGTPLRWTRVNDLPDYVYFNHSIHVNNGVGCVECHGQLDQMPLTRREAPLSMQWCLGCHRDPGPHLRPLQAVTSMRWKPEADPDALAADLLEFYDIPHSKNLTDCYVCHR